MPAPRIKGLKARQIFDSRGLPTVEADVVLDNGARGRAAVPSGASTGIHEAVELRDEDPRRCGGKGVLKAVAHVQGEIAEALKGLDAREQESIDEALIRLDGTENKSRLGANAILSVSLAVSRAAAAAQKAPLYRYWRGLYGRASDPWTIPTPMLNVVNGGRHADNGLDIQEFMLVPLGLPSFSEALRAAAEIYQALKKSLSARGLSVAVGDEGGFAPRVKTHDEVFEILSDVVVQAGYEGRVRLALDAAASEFYKNEAYVFESENQTAARMTERYKSWVERYRLISLEDPLAEDDWPGWKSLTADLGSSVRVVGDDIFVTNPKRLEKGIRENVANAILIKLNQIGTVTETARTVAAAHKAGYAAIVSHRSGETEDTAIADLAVALGCGAIKSGAPCRSERLSKYNQLLRIEEELGPRASYAARTPFALESGGRASRRPSGKAPARGDAAQAASRQP